LAGADFLHDPLDEVVEDLELAVEGFEDAIEARLRQTMDEESISDVSVLPGPLDSYSDFLCTSDL
jgi:hypothetical protein